MPIESPTKERLMASIDFGDLPSSPLSSVPSDFDRQSPPPGLQRNASTQHNEDLTVVDEPPSSPTSSGATKRKARGARQANPRASKRRDTGPLMEATLTEIKQDIIMPKMVRSTRRDAAIGERDDAPIVMDESHATTTRLPDSPTPTKRSSPVSGTVATPPKRPSPVPATVDRAEAELKAHAVDQDPAPTKAKRTRRVAPERIEARTETEAHPATQTSGLEDDTSVENVTKDTADPPKSERRSSRRKLSPPPDLDDFEAQLQTASPAISKKLRPIRGNWSSDHLLTNPKSKLASCNLSDLLSHERAWEALDRSQQLELIAMLPSFAQPDLPELPDDIPTPNVLRQVMKSNSAFRADVRLFQEDLAAGRYDSKWLEDAQNAMERRAQGRFDAWKERNREEFWGQKQKVDWRALSGDSAQHTLADMTAAGLFEIGDIWLLRVLSNRHGTSVEVEKEAKIISIANDHTLSFSFPPGQAKISAPSNGDDIVIADIRTPNTILTTILKEDGRLAGVRRANALKDFRCIRMAQDMGSLFDVRELYHSRQGT